MISQCKYCYFFGKIAISSTPFCPISPQQFSLSQYCMKHNSEKILTDEKFIFNHENASTVWIKLSSLGFEGSNRVTGCRNMSIRNYFCLVKYNEVYVLGKKPKYIFTPENKVIVTVEVNLGPQ